MVDIVIITTLDVEFDAVVKELDLKKSETKFEAYGSINNYDILCIKSNIRGNIESAINTITTLLTNKNPKYVFLVGYAGGIKGREDVALNKVVVANQIKYFEYKKIKNGKPYPREPSIITPSTRITDKAEVLAQENNNIIIGEILSGETITNELDEELLKRYDKAVAVETEAGGIGYAITKFMYKEDRVIHYGVIKGISDFVNVKESSKDREQNARSASIEAAKVTKAIIEKLTSEYVKNNLLKEYLANVEELYYKPNKIDNRALSEYYIEPNLIKVSVDTWYKEVDEIKEYSEWKIDDFLNSSDWLTIIGAEFGMGKSSYAKHIANHLATLYLKGKGKYIPIYVNLEDGFDNNNIYKNYSPDQLIEKFNNNILLILDGLDEYPTPNGINDIDALLTKLREYNKKKNIKIIITTRLIENYPEILKIKEYVRLKPFTEYQVNEFFEKYNIDLTYDELQELGFSEEDITKPLFVWMWAYMYSINKKLFKNLKSNKLAKLDDVTRNRIVMTLLYHNFINTIVRGKHREEAPVRFKKSYLAEKELLKVIAAIHNIYGKLEGDINELIKPFKIEIKNLNKAFLKKALDYITESYFYIREETYTSNKVYRFIHKSMQEYLLAEYYYKNIKAGNLYRLNVGMPSEECIEFLHGLVDILKHYDMVKDMLDYPEGVDPLINEKDYGNIINNFKEIIEDDRIILFGIEKNKNGNEKNKNGNFVIGKANNANRYENLFVHKWVAVSILSWLRNNKYLDVNRDELKNLIRISSHVIPDYLKNLSGANLSKVDLSKADLSNAILFDADLSKADLSRADLFDANLSGAKLSGANFSGANLFYANLSKADLFEANLSNANLSKVDLSNAMLKRANLFGADLSGAILKRANLFDALLADTDLSAADLSKVDLSNAILKRANLSRANLSNAILANAILADAILVEANLSNAILANAILVYAYLSKANLSNANLAKADIFDANLSGAKLSGANLFHVDLRKADLSGADLSNANLFKVDLSGANLSGGILSGAILSRTNLANSNLERVTLTDIILYLFTWNENDTTNNLKEWLESLKFEIKKFEFNNNTLNITTDERTITIELKKDKAILKVGNYKEELLAFKENDKIKIYLPIEVNDRTYTKGIILTHKNDEKSILKALENLPPNFRKIVLRDNPNYKEIWSKYHGNNSQD